MGEALGAWGLQLGHQGGRRVMGVVAGTLRLGRGCVRGVGGGMIVRGGGGSVGVVGRAATAGTMGGLGGAIGWIMRVILEMIWVI